MKCLFLIAFVFSQGVFAFSVKDGVVKLDKLEDYSFCQTKDSSGNDCHEALKRWVEAHPNDAFAAAKLTRKHMNHWAAIPFFAKAFAAKDEDCYDDDLFKALKSADDLPKDTHSEIHSSTADIRKKCKEIKAKNKKK